MSGALSLSKKFSKLGLDVSESSIKSYKNRHPNVCDELILYHYCYTGRGFYGHKSTVVINYLEDCGVLNSELCVTLGKIFKTDMEGLEQFLLNPELCVTLRKAFKTDMEGLEQFLLNPEKGSGIIETVTRWAKIIRVPSWIMLGYVAKYEPRHITDVIQHFKPHCAINIFGELIPIDYLKPQERTLQQLETDKLVLQALNNYYERDK